MSNDIYKILNNFYKLTEQKPQPTEQQAAAKPKTQLQESIEQVNEKYIGFKNALSGKKLGKEFSLNEMDKSQPSSDRGGESSGDPYAKGGKATPVKTKDMAKHAEKTLRKSMDKAYKKDVKEEQQDESALQAYLGKKKYGEKGMKALQQAGREGASKEKMAKIRAQHDKMDEQQGVAEGGNIGGEPYDMEASLRGKSVDELNSLIKKLEGKPASHADAHKLVAAAKKIRAEKIGKKNVSEGSLNEGQYEMMMRNGQVKKFIAKDDADAKRIAAGHGAKSVIRLKGGVPAGKVSEQGVAEGSLEEVSLGLAKRARDKAEYFVDMDYDDLRAQPYGYSEKQRKKFQQYIDRKEPRAKGDRDWDPPKKDVAEDSLNEKAVSKAQQKFMGMVHAAQKGGKAASPEVAKVAKGMSKKAAKDYASTKHKGLPQHVNETIIKALQEGYTKEQIVQFLLKESDKDYWKDLMKDVPDKSTVSKTVHKGHYGTEYQGDSDEDDDGQTKKITKPEGEKRGRGRPKGVKNRVVRAGEKKATVPAGEKRGRGRPPGSKNKMRESWIAQNNSMIAEAYTKLVEKELGQTYRADRMPNIPAPVPTDPTWIKDPKTGEWIPDVPKPAAKPAPKPAPAKGTEKRSDIEGDMAVAEMMRLAGMEGKLHGKQHKLDVDNDGDIEADDLADLRAGKKVDERVSIDASPEELQQQMQNKQTLSQRMSQQAADPAYKPMPGNKLSPVDQYNAIQQDVNKAYMPARGSQLGPQNNLRNDSDAGRYAAPGLGDQGQFFGGMKEEGVAGEAGYTSQMDKASDDFVKKWKNDNEPEVALGAKGSGWGDTPAKAEPAQANLYTPDKTDRTKTKQKPNQYHRFTMKEFDMDEGNEFTGALDAARDAGKKEFEVDGRTYPVKESQLDECGEMGPMANGLNSEQEGKMNVNTSMSSDGTKSVTVTADGEAAVELMQLLALAGMEKSVQMVKPEVNAMPMEEKDSRYEANTTPAEEVLPLEVQLKGGDGDVAGKEKKMSKDGSARFSDNPLATERMKESISLKMMKEYEGIKVKK